MYLVCAGRIGELSSLLWEDVRQVEHEGRLVWMFSYIKEKQDGRPEKMESILSDEISNIVFMYRYFCIDLCLVSLLFC